MSSFGNFVQCQVSGPVTIDATAIDLLPVVAPYTLPPVGGGLLVLVDSPGNPSFIEVVRYSSRSGQQLQGVTRGQEGTVARAWSGTIFAFQSLMAGDFQTLLNAKQGGHVNLDALSGLTGAADRLPYFTGAGAMSLATLTAAGRALIGAASADAQLTTLEFTATGKALAKAADAAAGRVALGLGTAATSNVTTSATDTTAGRLLTTDHGVNLGATQRISGRKVFEARPQTGGMADSTGGLGSTEVMGDTQKAAMLALHRTGSHAVYFGLDTDNKLKVGGWSMGNNAYELFHTGNILGSVSQSGGVPTGAIIERGSNANGTYVKYADGTLICAFTRTLSGISVTTTPYAVTSWTFPATFSGSPVYASTINISGWVYQYLCGYEGIDSAHMASIYILRITGADQTQTHHITHYAIGRWF